MAAELGLAGPGDALETMASEQQLANPEWLDDAKPVVLCMVCREEYPPDQVTCPKCHVALSIVHRCPQCSRIVSGKHVRCPYCTKSFIHGDEMPSPQQPVPSDAIALKAKREEHDLQRQKKILLVCVISFFAVFAIATLIKSYRSKPGPGALMGSSYALGEVAMRNAPSVKTFSVGRVPAGAIVEITGIQQDEEGQAWFEIRSNNVSGYVRVNELAPPKGKDQEAGYSLLKLSLTALSDPSEIQDAAQAVQLYRKLYPAEPRGQELLWLLAEKEFLLGMRTGSGELIAAARKSYLELESSGGDYAAKARESLRRIPDTPRATGGKASMPAIEVIGANNTWKVPDSRQALPHRLMLLSRTQVLVRLPQTQKLHAGDVLSGQTASNVVAGGEVAVPAGSRCRVKVTEAPGGNSSQIGLQLQSLEISGQSYDVDTLPVRLPLSTLAARSAPVSFQLRKALLLAR